MTSSSLIFNALLAQLPGEVIRQWQPHLETVLLSRDQCLHDPQHDLNHVYFPLTAIVSLSYMFLNGATAAMALVGREGMVGIHGVVGACSPVHSAVVQVAGRAIRLPLALAGETLLCHREGSRVLMRYLHTRLMQIGQISLGRSHHSLTQRLAFLLLICQDRSVVKEIVLTQDRIARIMGVRREGVTRSLLELSQQGLIETRRGHIQIQDRAGLQTLARESYDVLQAQEAWLFNARLPSPAT